MDMMEKVERLREKADISYEEAKAALEEAGGDLLDAMVLLERAGRVHSKVTHSYSTEYEEQKQYVKVQDKVDEQEEAAPDLMRSIKKLFRSCIRFIKQTTFNVTRDEKILFRMPTAVFALLLLFFWQGIIPVMVIALFFRVRYSFQGSEAVDTANNVLNKAGELAEDITTEFKKDERAG